MTNNEEQEQKLTPFQLETLRVIANGSVTQRKLGYAAWRIQGANPSTVGRLVAKKLAAWGRMDGDMMSCTITEAGLSVIEGG